MKRRLWGLLMTLLGAGLLVAYGTLVPVPTSPALVDAYIAGGFIAVIAAIYVTLTPLPKRWC